MEIRVEEHSRHIVIVTIDNQPRRNAMSRQMMAELPLDLPALVRRPCGPSGGMAAAGPKRA